ncbi:MFS general substrate transporter [Cylindrobasidium torrendii FP15055 ss-10]|uniref:MFS general substrate transporter n=1 Tax=Cylindrobasidium torrendii FP15055 ss-10 TaxID=1314674 RepID=A0A0D7BMI2_9AGAR|nr:MFS general substrate transporter [Cylindrobasidium torrendii FP15055 ss-10]
MTATQVDEETPLLRQEQTKPKRTPLPWFQLFIVLVLQLAEPLTSQVIYPFAPQLMRDIGVTHGDETKVAHYVGLMQSLFFFTQAFTVLHWSRLSDRIGRKPVILTGLAGLAISMYCFGLSKTFPGLVTSRALNGALNGNIGVIKSMMAEMTDSTNIAQAYAYMPISWSTGAVLGPIIGGALARPADLYPDLFGDSQFLKDYPYFLPCAIPATFTVIAWFVTLFYLQETAHGTTSWRELFRGESSKATKPTSPVVEDPEERAVPISKLFIRKVVVAGANYAMLSLCEITFRAIQPVFMSTPHELGGLGLTPSTIGKILSGYGIVNGLFQVFAFARLNNAIGSKATFLIGIASCIPSFACYPIMSHLIKSQGMSSRVWIVLAIQIMLSVLTSMSYGAVFIYIAAASPNRASLGATNGLCQMLVSVFRAVGPAAANSLYSISLKKNLLDGYLVYYVLLVIVVLSLFVASLLPRRL